MYKMLLRLCRAFVKWQKYYFDYAEMRDGKYVGSTFVTPDPKNHVEPTQRTMSMKQGSAAGFERKP